MLVPRTSRASSCSGSSTRASCASTSWRCSAGWDRVHPRLRHHRAVLRPLHAGDLRARLRAARRATLRRGALDFAGRVPAVTPRGATGELALVLHTHMPYVEGFGTWPFGEEWLWEAIAGSLPAAARRARARRRPAITLSLTPVLGDQLEAPGVAERFLAFLREVRARDAPPRTSPGSREAGHDDLARRARGLAATTTRARPRASSALGGDLLGRAGAARGLDLRGHARGAAAAGHRRRRAAAGRGRHRGPPARFGALARRLLAARVRARALARPAARGGRRPRHLRRPDRRARPRRARPAAAAAHARPARSLVPIDRATMELVWSDGGYPAHAAYRDYHHRTVHDHRAWANDGARLRPDARSRAGAREHAADFVARVSRARRLAARGGPVRVRARHRAARPLVVRGAAWLDAVVDEAGRAGPGARAARRRARAPRAGGRAPRELPVTTWGTPARPRDVVGARASPTRLAARATPSCAARGRPRAAGPRAVRELLALQASDWAFLAHRGLAGPTTRASARTATPPRSEAARLRLGSACASRRSRTPRARRLDCAVPLLRREL